jgi:hypothetical protein
LLLVSDHKLPILDIDPGILARERLVYCHPRRTRVIGEKRPFPCNNDKSDKDCNLSSGLRGCRRR